MLRIAYLYDVPGWALHRLGEVLAERLAPLGIALECIDAVDWHREPRATDILYLSYSGLWQPGFDYRRWCGTLLTTVHDPCEISHFENRMDWSRGPFIPLPLAQFDRVSAISHELVTILRTAYQWPVIRTPTWPTTSGTPAAEARRAPDGPLRAVSSTNMQEHFSAARILRRFLRPGPYLRDHRGRVSPRQWAALLVTRRRKNLAWLRAIDAHFRGSQDIACAFRTGHEALLARAAYEQVMRQADVYVCTSTMEGGPLPVLEAVWNGQAVLSTPVGQVEEWVIDGENGRICRSSDDFIAALEAYRADPAMLRRHQARSRAVAAAARFPLEAWTTFLTGQAAGRSVAA